MWEKEKKTMQVKETENKSVKVEEMTGREIKAGNGELTEEGESPKGESWVAIPEAELEGLIQKAAKAAVSEFKRQEEKDKKRDKYHNTFALMKCYRDAVFHIEHAVSDGEQLGLAGMTEEQQRTYLESVRRSRFKTLIMTAHIDKAIEEIERRRKEADREVEYRAFRPSGSVLRLRKELRKHAGDRGRVRFPFQFQGLCA